MRSKIVCLSTVLLLGSISAWTQPAPPYTIVGSGADSCGQYLEVRSGNQQSPEVLLKEFMMISWAQGYISGMNAYRVVANPKWDRLLLPDAPSIKAYLDKYCRDNPLQTVKDGSFALFTELEAKSR
jgi:hypothetical protein